MSATTPRQVESSLYAGPTRLRMRTTTSSPNEPTLTLQVSVTSEARRRRDSSPPSPRCSRAMATSVTNDNGPVETRQDPSTRVADGPLGPIRTSSDLAQHTVVVETMTRAMTRTKATLFRYPTTETPTHSRLTTLVEFPLEKEEASSATRRCLSPVV